MNVLMQFVSLTGALLVLGAFYGLQRGWWSRHGRAYLWANLVGATLLLVVAAFDRRAGFVVLEGAWAAVALRSLMRPVAPAATDGKPPPH